MSAANGMILISPDYHLLFPSTGFDNIVDVKALFHFLFTNINEHLSDVTLDASRIAVAGVSAGSYLARLAAVYIEPRPRAFLSLFGMGGNWFSDHYLALKTNPMPYFGYMVSQEVGAEYARFANAAPIVEVSLVWNLATGKVEDDMGRMNLLIWWWQNGTYVDHVSGEVGLSERLRALPAAEREAAVPANLTAPFPQLHIDSNFPPTMLIHGKEDSVVPAAESEYSHKQLLDAGVRSELHILPGAEHGLVILPGFRRAPQAEGLYKKAFEFLAKELA